MRILVLLSRFPYPLDKGDKLRAYFQIRELSKRHEVALCALTRGDVRPEALAALTPFCKQIEVLHLRPHEALMGVARSGLFGAPFQTGVFYSARLHSELRGVVREFRPQCGLFQLVRTAPYAKDLDLDVTLDYMDALSWGTRGIAQYEGGARGQIRANEAARLSTYERAVRETVRGATIISEQDRDRLDPSIRDTVSVVPNGVDLEAFSPRATPKHHDILFAGNMSYPPNVAAASTLALEVLPTICKKRPQTTLAIAGVHPSPAVKRLASSAVHVTGWVESMPSCYASARVFVAPMSLGSGMSNKVLQALAMGMPCVTTREIARAIKAPKDCLRVGANVNEIADMTLEILANERVAKDLGAAGRAFVEKHYQWSDASRLLEDVLVAGGR